MDELVATIITVLFGVIAYLGYRMAMSKDESTRAEGKTVNNAIANVLIWGTVGSVGFAIIYLLIMGIKAI